MSTNPMNSENALTNEFDDQIKQELADALNDQDLDQLMATHATPNEPDATHSKPNSSDTPSISHQLIRGRIAAVRNDDVFVDLHGTDVKNQGIVPRAQFEREPRIGSIMDFVIDRHDEDQGLIILSREGAVSHAAWDQLRKGSTVEARVTGINKGGLELELAGNVKAFMPASQIDLHYIENLDQYIGQKLQAQVQEINHTSRHMVLSRRQHLESQRRRLQTKLWEEIQVGQSKQGIVSGIADYGIFVDIGGQDGLVHVSDMSYARVEKPADLVSVGQTVTVKVLKLDPDNQRISLGIKQTQPDPWLEITNRIKIGDHISARVTKLADFGLFAEVEPGVNGLVPLNELSWKHIRHPSEIANEGDVLKLVVQQIDLEKKRMSLSLKEAQGDPWVGAEHKYGQGKTIEAIVLRTTDFGAFVELERGIEALVHISELSDQRVNRVEDMLTVGEKYSFRVLEMDEQQRRARLSLKSPTDAVQNNPTTSTAPTHSGPRLAKAHKKPPKPLKGGIE